MAVVRSSVVTLDGALPAFESRCYIELVALVPSVLGSTADHGREVARELAGQVLAVARGTDDEGAVAVWLARVGVQLYVAGFPVDGYQGAAHAVLRAARHVYPLDWDSTLSSAWVAYLAWAGPLLAQGAAAEHARGPVPGRGAPVAAPVAAPAEPRSTRWWRRGGAVGDDPPPRPRGRQPARRTVAAEPSVLPLLPPSPPPGRPSGGRVVPSSLAGTTRGTFDAFSHLGDDPVRPAPGPPATPGAGREDRLPSTLTEVHQRLLTGAFAGNEWALDAVLTRVALRTGADVRAPRPDQVADPAAIREVIQVLARMGYGELAGEQLERPRWWSRRSRTGSPR